MARRNTKELILSTSLALFNELGEPGVTTNHIADEADISPGNLYYHFRSKDDITLELFKRFVTRMRPLLDVPPDSSLAAEDLWFQIHLAFEAKADFRFLYRNLSDLTERIPSLGSAFRGLLMREREAAKELLAGLEREGVLSIRPLEKRALVDNLQIAMTYWIPYAGLYPAESGNAPSRAVARVLLMVAPYLREGERQEISRMAEAYFQA